MFTLMFPDGGTAILPNGLIWATFAVAIAVILTFYALRSIALWKMAKRHGLKKAFLAWIPCVWVYVACKLVGKVHVFGKTFEKWALAFCIVFSFAEVLTLAYEFFVYFPIVGNFLAGNQMFMFASDPSVSGGLTKEGYTEIVGGLGIYGETGKFVNPYVQAGMNIKALNVSLKVIYYLGMVLDLVSLIFTVSLYVQLFKKYWPQHFIIAAVLSFMGLFPIFVFIIRNKQPIDYNEFMRQRYNTFYANGNPYGGQYRNNPPRDVPPTPFEEFADKDEIDPGDPFAEFSDKNK